jgi:hypothetical protein
MTAVKHLSVEELERVIEAVARRTLEEHIEDRDALASRPYLDSIQEARDDYRAGETTSLRDLRGE